MPKAHRPRGAALNAEQKKVAADIANRFDPKNDGPEIRREMQEAFEQANIRPGQDLKAVLEDAGFEVGPRPERPDLKAASSKAGRRGARNLGPPPGLPSFVTSYLDKRREGSVSEAETNAFMSKVREMAPPPRGIFVNILA